MNSTTYRLTGSPRTAYCGVRRMLRGSVVAVLLMTGLTGCFSIPIWGTSRNLKPTEQPLPATASAEEVLARVNKNCYSEYSPHGLRRYRCDDMRVSMQGLPVPMKASMVVEEPRNLRIRVSAPLSGGEGLDVGSNDEHFWYWSKHSEPSNVLLCNHDHVAYASQVMTLPLPFRPDWLMEVLGVVPISGSDFELHRKKPNSPIVELVTIERLPDQQPVRRIAKVDTRVGVALEHRVESMNGQLIARATLTRHNRDAKTKLVLPKELQIEWPAAGQQLSLTLVLNTIEFNPPAESPAMWHPPTIDGSPPLDIGLFAMQKLGIEDEAIARPAQRREIPQGAGSATLDDTEFDTSTDAGPVDPSEELADQWVENDDRLEMIERPIRQTADAQDDSMTIPDDTAFSRPSSELPLLEDFDSPRATDDARPFPE